MEGATDGRKMVVPIDFDYEKYDVFYHGEQLTDIAALKAGVQAIFACEVPCEERIVIECSYIDEAGMLTFVRGEAKDFRFVPKKRG